MRATVRRFTPLPKNESAEKIMNKKTEVAATSIACPLARTARLVGDEWILLILRELFKRPHKFDELQKASGAATNILTNRLQRMMEAGLIKKIPYQERPPRYEYKLARAGYAMLPMLLEMMRYSDDYFPCAEEAPNRLRHLDCGELTQAGQRCSHCGGDLSIHNLRLEPNAQTQNEETASD